MHVIGALNRLVGRYALRSPQALYLACISAMSPVYLPYISPTSPLYLPRWVYSRSSRGGRRTRRPSPSYSP